MIKFENTLYDIENNKLWKIHSMIKLESNTLYGSLGKKEVSWPNPKRVDLGTAYIGSEATEKEVGIATEKRWKRWNKFKRKVESMGQSRGQTS